LPAVGELELIKVCFQLTLDRITRRISANKRELVSPDNNGDTTQEAAIKKQQHQHQWDWLTAT